MTETQPKTKLIELDFSDPQRMKDRIDKMSPQELKSMGRELAMLGRAIDLLGSYVMSKLLAQVLNEDTQTPEDKAMGELFKGKVAQA